MSERTAEAEQSVETPERDWLSLADTVSRWCRTLVDPNALTSLGTYRSQRARFSELVNLIKDEETERPRHECALIGALLLIGGGDLAGPTPPKATWDLVKSAFETAHLRDCAALKLKCDPDEHAFDICLGVGAGAVPPGWEAPVSLSSQWRPGRWANAEYFLTDRLRYPIHKTIVELADLVGGSVRLLSARDGDEYWAQVEIAAWQIASALSADSPCKCGSHQRRHSAWCPNRGAECSCGADAAMEQHTADCAMRGCCKRGHRLDSWDPSRVVHGPGGNPRLHAFLAQAVRGDARLRPKALASDGLIVRSPRPSSRGEDRPRTLLNEGFVEGGEVFIGKAAVYRCHNPKDEHPKRRNPNGRQVPLQLHYEPRGPCPTCKTAFSEAETRRVAEDGWVIDTRDYRLRFYRTCTNCDRIHPVIEEWTRPDTDQGLTETAHLRLGGTPVCPHCGEPLHRERRLLRQMATEASSGEDESEEWADVLAAAGTRADEATLMAWVCSDDGIVEPTPNRMCVCPALLPPLRLTPRNCVSVWERVNPDSPERHSSRRASEPFSVDDLDDVDSAVFEDQVGQREQEARRSSPSSASERSDEQAEGGSEDVWEALLDDFSREEELERLVKWDQYNLDDDEGEGDVDD